MNEVLYEKVLKAINELFSDTSVNVDATKVNLENIKEEIDLLIETLETENFPE